MSDIGDDNFGYALHRRRKELATLLDEPGRVHHQIFFKGELTPLPIVRVPIELPKYRLSNGRTASLQEEWLVRNEGYNEDFFERDPELAEAQAVQNQLLLELVKEAGLLNLFRKDPSQKQNEPLILDENGFVINGNRRLACWRSLLKDDRESYQHFSHVDVVVLPHCDEREIDKIEANLQIKQDIRADYSWETRAIMMRQKQRAHAYTENDIADIYGMSKKDVGELWEMLDLAKDYLRTRNREQHWSLVRNDENAFKQLRKSLKKVTDMGDRQVVKYAAYALIDDSGSAGGRLYAQIPRITEHLDKVRHRLTEAFPSASSDHVEHEPDPFDGVDVPSSQGNSFALAAELVKENNVADVREVVVSIIEEQASLQRERDNAGYLLKVLSEANGKLQSALSDGLRADTKTDGAESQLKEIEDRVSQIREWLNNHYA